MKEIWIPIPGFPNYEFNPQTLRVKSLERKVKNPYGNYIRKEKILKLYKSSNGYYAFSLWKEGKKKTLSRSRISWLVNKGSLPPKGFDIDHIDGIKTNDHFENLQVLRHRDNNSKGYQQLGKILPTGVSWNKGVKKFQAQIRIKSKAKHLGYFNSSKEASEVYQKALHSKVY